MLWQRRLAALFVVLALAGCAEATTGQAGPPTRPIRPRTPGPGPSAAEAMAEAVAAVCSWRAVQDHAPPANWTLGSMPV
jgi:hypothetical protein